MWSVVDYDPNITVSFAPVDDLSTTVTFTGNEEFSAAGDYLLRLTVTDSLGMSDSDELVVRVRPEGFDGLEAHIQFENADPQLAVNSTVGIGYEGTIYGDPNAGFDVPDAKVGSGALQLFGQEYVEYSTLLGALDSITVSVWVNCPDYEVGGRIIQKWSADSSGNGWFLRIRNGNTNDANPAGLIGSGYNSDGNFQTAWYGITVNNEWAHVVLTFEDGVQRLWVNGALQDEDTEVEFSPEDMYTQVAIGRRTNNDSEYFQGLIDEVRIYDYALSIDEVKALYVADGGDPSWDKCPEGSSGLAGDLTGDCKVDLQDLAVLGADWQSVYSTGTLATVAQEWLDCDSFDLLDCF